jgi:hypothetical protein
MPQKCCCFLSFYGRVNMCVIDQNMLNAKYLKKVTLNVKLFVIKEAKCLQSFDFYTKYFNQITLLQSKGKCKRSNIW